MSPQDLKNMADNLFPGSGLGDNNNNEENIQLPNTGSKAGEGRTPVFDIYKIDYDWAEKC